MFEVGADTGDDPASCSSGWSADHLDRVYPLAQLPAVRMNADGRDGRAHTVRATAHAAATIMPSASIRASTCPRYGSSAALPEPAPDKASLGSAVWARWVVDGDLGYEVDAREAPSGWTTGYLPLRKSKPFEEPAAPLPGQVYALEQVAPPSGPSTSLATHPSPTAITSKTFAATSTAPRRAPALRRMGD